MERMAADGGWIHRPTIRLGGGLASGLERKKGGGAGDVEQRTTAPTRCSRGRGEVVGVWKTKRRAIARMGRIRIWLGFLGRLPLIYPTFPGLWVE
jgi:hypothetical protein